MDLIRALRREALSDPLRAVEAAAQRWAKTAKGGAAWHMAALVFELRKESASYYAQGSPGYLKFVRRRVGAIAGFARMQRATMVLDAVSAAYAALDTQMQVEARR